MANLTLGMNVPYQGLLCELCDSNSRAIYAMLSQNTKRNLKKMAIVIKWTRPVQIVFFLTDKYCKHAEDFANTTAPFHAHIDTFIYTMSLFYKPNNWI